MIKKVKVDLLRPGVFVADFNAPWISHPFIFGKKRITSYKDIEKIKKTGITEVYIDTTRGLDVHEVPSKEDFLQYFKEQTTEESKQTPERILHTTLKEELREAQAIRLKAKSILDKANHNARYGTTLAMEEIIEVVSDIVSSILRNPDALLLLSSIREKDKYTYEHSLNMAILIAGVTRSLKLEHELILHYTLGALLHDIGKNKIDPLLLNKTSPLTPKEFEIMKRHVQYGVEIAREHDVIEQPALSIIAEHHERVNGTGYPRKLVDQQITRGGKLAAIIDMYDALISDRPYHKAISPPKALKQIFEQRLIFFDEELVESFIRFLGIYPPGTLVRLNSGFVGVVLETSQENILRPRVRLIYDGKRKMTITPKNLDLSHGIGELHKIVEIVEPKQINIDSREYLIQMLHEL